MPSSSELYDFGSSATGVEDKIYDTWVNLIETHKRVNGANKLIVVFAFGHPLEKYKTYDDQMYIKSFTEKSYAPLDNKIIKLLKKNDAVILDSSSVIISIYSNVVEYRKALNKEGVLYTSGFIRTITEAINRSIKFGRILKGLGDNGKQEVSFKVYSDDYFNVIDLSGNARYYTFYCKKELIHRFSAENPELTFKELII